MGLFNKFKKESTRVGLDIGNKSLKLVEIKEVAGEVYLTAVGVKELRPGVIVNGDIKEKREFIEAVTTLVEQCDASIIDVVISLGGQGLLSDKFTFKIEPNENVNDTIMYEASQRSPFDGDDITRSYKILRRFPETNEVEVLLVAAKNLIMQTYIDALYEAGLRPVIVDVDTFAFNNCYARESYAEATLETLVLIDIGFAASRVIFIRNGLFHSSREINTAGDYFVKSLQKQLKIPEPDAVKLLSGQVVASVTDEDFLVALEYVLEEFCASFDMAFSYLRKTEEVEKIDKIVLGGGGAYTPKIVDYLKERFDTEVVRSNPFKFLRYDNTLFKGIEPADIAALITVAVGLAIREVN